MLLTEVIEKTDKVFEPETELQVPNPGPHWQRKLEALEQAKLFKQRAAAIYDMRCEQATLMGFEKLEPETMVEMLMGEQHTDTGDSEERQNHEWFYNHHTGEIIQGSECKWGSKATDFIRMERKSLWFLPPFAKQVDWKVRMGKLDYLKREIPYGVLLRIEEVKKTKLFNSFGVIAPMEAWERPTQIDPIVFANVWEVPPNDDGKYMNAGQVTHYFVAQW